MRVPFLHGFPNVQPQRQSELASLERANAWLNSPPLTASALRGKVVLVDFWTYTCINWRRTLPYVRAWAEKYKDQGLVVIGVHAPEFAFEKNLDNVRWAVKDMRVDYPVAVDNDHAHMARLQEPILAGALFHRCAGARSASPLRRGRIRAIRNDHPGIAGRGRSRRHRPEAGDRSTRQGVEAAADWRNLRSPENYRRIRAHRELCLARRSGPATQPRMYELPARLRLNEWALVRRLDGEARSRRAEQGQREASRTAFTRAIFISSWARQRQARPCDFAC